MKKLYAIVFALVIGLCASLTNSPSIAKSAEVVVNVPSPVGCGLSRGQVVNTTVLAVDKIMCVLSNDSLPIEQIIMKCTIQPGDVERVIDIVGQHRAMLAKAREDGAMAARVEASLKPKACGPSSYPDAGADGGK